MNVEGSELKIKKLKKRKNESCLTPAPATGQSSAHLLKRRNIFKFTFLS